MQGYYFTPMMPIYSKFVHAPTEWLTTPEARSLMAKSIKHCRKTHGRAQGKCFYNALIWVGVIYPQALGTWERKYLSYNL